MYRNIVCPAQGQNFWLTTPPAGVPDGYAVSLKLLRGHDPSIFCACTLLVAGGEEGKELVRMTIYVA